jgi:chromosome partitioning protein
MNDHFEVEWITIIAFAHHKGGTGKTTSCLNIAGFLVKSGNRVLVVDVDPQANATSGLGLNPDAINYSMYDLFMGMVPGYKRVPIDDIIQETRSGIDIAPSNLELVGAEPFLYTLEERATLLKEILLPVRERYDFILIDTPPSMGQYVINGLVASDHTVVTFDRGVFALNGLHTLMAIFSDIKEIIGNRITPDLAILTRWDCKNHMKSGIRGFLSRFSDKNSPDKKKEEEMIKEFEAEVSKYFNLVYPVPYGREIYEAQKAGLPISHFAPDSPAGKAYYKIAEVVQKWKI